MCSMVTLDRKLDDLNDAVGTSCKPKAAVADMRRESGVAGKSWTDTVRLCRVSPAAEAHLL
jgi:hypothetical protein